MPLTTDNNDEMTNKQQAKSTSPDVISISSDEEDNDLDSILDRLQNLNFDTPSEKEEEEIEKKKPKVILHFLLTTLSQWINWILFLVVWITKEYFKCKLFASQMHNEKVTNYLETCNRSSMNHQ